MPPLWVSPTHQVSSETRIVPNNKNIHERKIVDY
jgi:hypothetical protein